MYRKGTGITKEMALNNPELAQSYGVLLDLHGKSWGCEYCAEVHKIALKKDLRHGIEQFWEQGLDTYTFTVTSHLKMTLQDWRDAWSKYDDTLKLWLHRLGIRDIYVNWEKEYGKQHGMRHVHGFIAFKNESGNRLKINDFKDRLSEIWEQATKGAAFITNAKRLLKRHGMKAVNYAIKYIAKQESQKHFTKGERHFFFSHNWPRAPKREKTGLFEPIIYPRAGEMLALEIQKIPSEIRRSWLEKSRAKAKVKSRVAQYGEKFKDSRCYHLDDWG